MLIKFDITIEVFVSNIVQIESGIFWNLFKSNFLSVGPPAVLFIESLQIPSVFDVSMFQEICFPQKLILFGSYFGKVSFKKCSYGPYGPFWFSVNK